MHIFISRLTCISFRSNPHSSTSKTDCFFMIPFVQTDSGHKKVIPGYLHREKKNKTKQEKNLAIPKKDCKMEI